jgi:hypothetical protein
VSRPLLDQATCYYGTSKYLGKHTMQTSHISLDLIKNHFHKNNSIGPGPLTEEQVQAYEGLGFQRLIEVIKTQLINIEIEKTNNVAKACKSIGVSTSSYYKWSERDSIL